MQVKRIPSLIRGEAPVIMPPMHIDPLPRRILLSGDFASLTSKGTLVVLGDENANVITVALVVDQITATRGSESMSFPVSSVLRGRIEGMGGDDTLTNNVVLRSTILGGDGNDTLTGGEW